MSASLMEARARANGVEFPKIIKDSHGDFGEVERLTASLQCVEEERDALMASLSTAEKLMHEARSQVRFRV